MKNTSENFAYYKELDINYEQALEKVTEALKEQGFGVLTTIDMQATLKQKLNVDFRKYAILGACNPPFAHQSLRTQLNVGLLLPCNVIVYEKDGGSVVEILDPKKMMEVSGNPDLEPIALDAQSRLKRAIESLN